LTILYTFIGGFLGFVFLFVLNILSFRLGRNILKPIFGQSGLEMPVAVLVGCILGWICGNKAKDSQEQERINREIEEDRLKYEAEKTEN
jgi:hypothetical protein